MKTRIPRSARRVSERSRAMLAVAAASGLLLAGQLAVAMPAAAAVPTVGLGTADAYSVLAGTTVTNTGPTTLSGDLGVSPGSAITGFPPGTAAGATHAADAPALQAQADLVTAYNDAAGRAMTASVAGDLVGRTLTSGVYKSTGPLALSGALTLNGQGNPNAVFVFQVASTLITATASHISVLNGAQACNVFWQVGSSATLGTASTFQGTIMALTSIAVTTGVTVHGRALARNGAVTLDNDTFTSAACVTSPAAATSPATTAATTTHTPGTAATTPGITTPTATTTLAATGAAQLVALTGGGGALLAVGVGFLWVASRRRKPLHRR